MAKKFIKNILNSEKGVNNVNTDIYLGAEFKQKIKDLPYDEINYRLSQNEVYEAERKASNCFRITATIGLHANNVLFDSTGSINDEQLGLRFLESQDFKESQIDSNFLK